MLISRPGKSNLCLPRGVEIAGHRNLEHAVDQERSEERGVTAPTTKLTITLTLAKTAKQEARWLGRRL